MIFVTGPLFAGKREYIRRTLGLSQEEFTRKYEDAKKDKKELEAFISKLHRMTQERADELERAIRSTGR